MITSIFTLFSCRSDISQIQDCFQNYKAAVLSLDGERAANLVDNSTVEFYSNLLDKVKHFDSLQLEKESLTTKFEVFKIRHMITPTEIHGMNGKQLLTTLINHGISGSGNFEKYTLGDIEIRNDSAEAQKLSNNKLIPFRYLFIKEDTFWKIRSAASNPASDIAFKQLALNKGVTENEYIYELLEEISRKKPSPDIWKPIN